MSYIEFFEFKDHPFRITPDVEFYYTSQTHLQAYDSLVYFVGSDEGFFTLIGEPGTGKTITIRKFLNNLPEDVEYAYILFPSLKPEDMFKAVLEDFGYQVDGNVSKNSLFAGFRDFLTEKNKQGKRILLIIDEAQNLPVETLEELRILSNLETEKEKLIRFVLAGQPELADKLESTELRQLRQRISLISELNLLDASEVEKYVIFRLSKAGFSGKYPDEKFYKRLMLLTQGNPRLINLTMERALMSAFLSQSKALVMTDLSNAAESLKLERAVTDKQRKNTINTALVAVIILLCIVSGGLLMYKHTETLNAEKAMQKLIEKNTMLEQHAADIEQKAAAEPEPEVKEIIKEIVTETKAEESNVIKGYVITNNLNIRSTPETDRDNILAKLGRGTPVIVEKREDSWLYINVADQLYGWVYEDYILIPE
jgi:general secretion pathway protein A